MKNNIIYLFLLLSFTSSSFAQNFNNGIYENIANLGNNVDDARLNCWISRKHGSPIQKEKLNQVLVMGDICEHYPSSWIDSYISTEVSIIKNNKTIKAKGVNEKLTTEQQNLLKSAELNSTIVIEILYNFKNTISNKLEQRTMNFSIIVVPKTEAKFQEGDPMFFLREKATSKLAQINAPKFQKAIIHFSIDEKGKASNINLVESSNDANVDKLLLNLIHTMPQWHAAKDIKDKPVIQDLEFTIGYRVGC